MTATAATRSSLLIAAFCAGIMPAPAQETGDLDTLRQRALELVNASRADAGLDALSLGPVLNEAAQAHAADMVERDFYSHVTPDGRRPFDRFTSAGGSQWALSGENIATCSGCDSPPDIARVAAFHEGWMESPEHRENILSDGFDRLGFGIAGEADEVYAVQTFAGPGASEDTGSVTAEQARATALQEINTRREAEGLAPLKPSMPLDTVAERMLEALLADEAPTDDIFGLLPEGATGWTSLAVRSASRGGSGSDLTKGGVAAFIETWASSDSARTFGGADASDLGFAAETRSDGRSTAVAVFGGRD